MKENIINIINEIIEKNEYNIHQEKICSIAENYLELLERTLKVVHNLEKYNNKDSLL